MSGNLVDGQGNLERNWKAREKSGYLKISSYGRLSRSGKCLGIVWISREI